MFSSMVFKGYQKYSVRILEKEWALIRWKPLSESSIHGHAGKKCSFIVLNGSLNEKLFKSKKMIPRYHEPLRFGYVDDTMGKHQMHNKDNRPKYSFHYYR